MTKFRDKPPYAYRKVRRNKRFPAREYWYSQPPGLARVRIPYPYGSEEFKAFCEKRNREAPGAPPPPTGTFLHLADVYRGNERRGIEPSREWRRIAPRTKKGYNVYVDKLVDLWGKYPVSDLETEHVNALVETLAGTPHAANSVLVVLRNVLNLALRMPSVFGIQKNVAKDVQNYGRKEGVRAREKHWSFEEERKFLELADQTDPMVALAMRLYAHTGQRGIDIRAMRAEHYDGRRIFVMQSKTRKRLWVPCHKRLKPHLDQNLLEARTAGIENPYFIRGMGGNQVGERYFATRWDKIAKSTGTFHLNRQDLRRTAVIRLAEARCTVPEIAAITGHSLTQVESIMETYFVRTEKMANHAMKKLEAYEDRELKKERASETRMKGDSETFQAKEGSTN